MDGNYIKIMRKKLGLTQEQLARRLNVTFVSVNRWENGRVKPSPLAIRALKELEAEITTQ